MKYSLLFLAQLIMFYTVSAQNGAGNCKNNELLVMADSLSIFYSYSHSDSLLTLIFNEMPSALSCDSLIAEIARIKGNNYVFTNDLKRADSCFRLVREIFREANKTDSPALCRLKYDISGYHFIMGKADSALYYLDQCESCSKALDLDSRFIGVDLNLIKGQMFVKLGQYDSACIEFHQVLKDIKVKSDSISIAEAHNGLANCYNNQGKFRDAEIQFNKAIQIFESRKLNISDLFKLGIAYNDKGIYLRRQSRYEAAEEYYLKSIEIFELVRGKNNIDYCISLNNLGLLFELMGRFKEAESSYVSAISLMKQIVGEDHIEYANLLNNFAVYYMQIGFYNRAIDLVSKSLTIKRKIYPESHPKIVHSLNTLSKLHFLMGDYERANEYSQQSFELKLKYFTDDTVGLANVYQSIAMTELMLGYARRSDSMLLISKGLLENVLDSLHPRYNIVIGNIGKVKFELGDYSASQKYYKKSLKNRLVSLGASHPDLESSYRGLIYSSYMLGLETELEGLLLQYFDFKVEQIYNNIYHLSESEREQYFQRKMVPFFDFYFSIASKIRSEPIQRSMFTLSLLAKEFNLQASKESVRNILNSEDSTLIVAYNTWLGYKRQLSRHYYNKNLPKKSIEIIRDKCDSLSNILSYDFNSIQSNGLKIGAIDSLLQSNEAVVDFVEYDPIDSEQDSVSHMCAFVRTKDSLVYISLDRKIESFEQDTDSNIDRLNSWSTSVWSKIDKCLSDIDVIYLIPAGPIYQINFGSLKDTDGNLIIDKYEIHTTTNYMELTSRYDVKHDIERAIVIGGVNYTTEEQMKKRADTIENVWTSKRNHVFNYLPFTEEERQYVVSMCVRNGVSTSTFNKGDATESIFIEQVNSENTPDLIHIATHGYFGKENNHRIDDIFSDGILTWEDFQLHKNGLVFSTPDFFNENDDGILTGMEISELNLSESELVVLSTCESNLGIISDYEGVYNLVRAFKKSGAQNIIVTNTRIEDRDAYLFFRLFYDELFDNNENIHDAFYNTLRLLVVDPEKQHLAEAILLIE